MQSWLDDLDPDLQSELQEIISNSRLSEFYLALARDLDVMEAKLPDEVHTLTTPLYPKVYNPPPPLYPTVCNRMELLGAPSSWQHLPRMARASLSKYVNAGVQVSLGGGQATSRTCRGLCPAEPCGYLCQCLCKRRLWPR